MQDFADGFRLRTIVRKYSDHIGVPVEMPKTQYEDDATAMAPESRSRRKEEIRSRVGNRQFGESALTRPRTELKDDDYKEFYKHVSHDFDDPLTWSHNKVEGKLEYTSLLYVPKHAPFDLWNRDAPRGEVTYNACSSRSRRISSAVVFALRQRRGGLQRSAAQRVARAVARG
jgi:molecular chaperone HtpG